MILVRIEKYLPRRAFFNRIPNLIVRLPDTADTELHKNPSSAGTNGKIIKMSPTHRRKETYFLIFYLNKYKSL